MLTAPPNAPVEQTLEHPTVDSAPDDVGHMIAEAAYYIAAQRGFEPGHELDDWLAAEAQVLDRLAEARS